jgi:AcrR family transcriptional regulator
VGIGTFYHQFPDKSDLMRFLMDEEHQYRLRAIDALSAADLAPELTRVLGGSDAALLRAMIEACGIDERLRDFARDLRKVSRERLAAAVTRVRQARGIRQPALEASTAAFASLIMGDAVVDRAATDEVRRVIELLAFASADGAGRLPA